jgi:hypothetical protein
MLRAGNGNPRLWLYAQENGRRPFNCLTIGRIEERGRTRAIGGRTSKTQVGCYNPRWKSDRIKTSAQFMKAGRDMKKSFPLTMLVMTALLLAGANWLPSPAMAQKGVADLDVQHYKINAELIPSQQLLRANAEIKFIPVTDTRSAIFEMNGSLTIRRITRLDAPPPTPAPQNVPTVAARPNTREAKASKPASVKAAPTPAPTPASLELQFIQDNREKMEVRIDLGSVVPPINLSRWFLSTKARSNPPKAARSPMRGWLLWVSKVLICFMRRAGSPFTNTRQIAQLTTLNCRCPKASPSPGTANSPSSPRRLFPIRPN